VVLWTALRVEPPAAVPTASVSPLSSAIATNAVPRLSPFAEELSEMISSWRGSLVVQPSAPDARVVVDGTAVASGIALSVDTLAPHEVVVSAAGHETFRASVEVRDGQVVTLPVRLRATPRSLPAPPRAVSVAPPAPRPHSQASTASNPNGFINPF